LTTGKLLPIIEIIAYYFDDPEVIAFQLYAQFHTVQDCKI